MLRARTDPSAIGPWEKLLIQQNPDNSISLQSVANSLWVSAELGFGVATPDYAVFRARATVIGPWERFQLGRLQ
jgi:hypothetical protein